MSIINVNGEKRPIEEGLTLKSLVTQMGFVDKPVVCEVNLAILSKNDWEKTLLHDGDSVEIIGFVGGGASFPGIELSRGLMV